MEEMRPLVRGGVVDCLFAINAPMFTDFARVSGFAPDLLLNWMKSLFDRSVSCSEVEFVRPV